MNNKILMFAPGFAPYAASENICSSKLILAMLDSGFQVEVISRVDEGFNYSQDWSEPWGPLENLTQEVRYEVGNKIYRLTDIIRNCFKYRTLISGIRWADRAYKVALEKHRENRFDVILSRSPSDIGHLPALHFAKKTGLPWIANWNDPPSHLWPAPYVQDLRWDQKYFSSRFVKNVFENATLNTFPSKRLMDHVLSYVGEQYREKTTVIAHIGFNKDAACDISKDEKLKMCHAGNLSSERNPEIFFRGISKFLTQEDASERFQFEIIGVHDVKIEELAKKYNLTENLIVTGRLSYLDTLKQLAQNDVLAVIEAPCYKGIFLPSKITDYAHAGKPIIAISPKCGTMRDLLTEYGGGVVADNTSPNEICDALVKLYKAWKTEQLHDVYCPDQLGEVFSPNSIMNLYHEIFDSIKQ